MKFPAAALAAVTFLACLTGADSIRTPDLVRVEQLVFDATNRFRLDQGMMPVVADARLGRAARDFARFMAKTDKYGHDADGKQPADRARSQGYDYCVIAENIAYQFSSAGFDGPELAQLYFEGWKRSPGHRRNMLDAEVTDTAVAVARSDTTGRYYAVQMFARPRSACMRRRG